MPLDVKRTLVDQVWSLLEARAGFASRVGEGSRIKTSAVEWKLVESLRAGGDMHGFLPVVRVLVTGDSHPGEIALLSYAGDYPIPGKYEVEVRATFGLDHDAEVMPLENEIRLALTVQAGPFLGLDRMVKRRTWRATRKQEKGPETNGVLCTVCRLILSVETEVYPSELI